MNLQRAQAADPDQPDAVQIAPFFGLPGVHIAFQRNEEVFGEGEPADYIYQVKSGAVRTVRFSSDGRRQILAFHLPGDIFGLEFGAAHGFSAEAVACTDIILVRRSELESTAGQNRDAARALLHITQRTLQEAREHALLLARKGRQQPRRRFPAPARPALRQQPGTRSADVARRYWRLPWLDHRIRVAGVLGHEAKADHRLAEFAACGDARSPRAAAAGSCLMVQRRRGWRPSPHSPVFTVQHPLIGLPRPGRWRDAAIAIGLAGCGEGAATPEGCDSYRAEINHACLCMNSST